MAIARSKPTRNPDGSAVVLPSRTGAYGEAYVQPVAPPRFALADEGSYFSAQNATYGTAITAHAAPAIADTNTKPFIHMFNAGPTSVWLDYIWLQGTIANASATSVGWAAYVDALGTTSRTGAGTAITPVNVNAGSSTATAVTMFAGAVTAVSASSRRVMQRTIRPYIGVALDQYTFSFGNGINSLNTAILLASGVANIHTASGPIVIPSGGNLMFCQISPSGAATAATFEFEVGWSER